MALKLSPESFLNGVRQSGLIEPAHWDGVLQQLQQRRVDFTDAHALAQGLVDIGVVTPWQAEKLQQGRHKGFILGRYRLQNLLSKGEMSAVYVAEHVRMLRRCAIKVLPASKVRDTSYLARFHREAQAVASLDHPNIVRAYDVDQESEGESEIHFLVMEYVAGRNLEGHLRHKGKLEITEAADLIRQAALGLAHAHAAGLVHRDIKPENLLVDAHGTVKLLDLGIARFFKAHEEESLTLKHDEKVLGSADYLAPEQAIDSHKVDARADIYSLGCSLYFALTGHPPFVDGTLVQRLLAHQTKAPPSVRVDRPDTPDELVAILEKMMAKNVDDRYQNATEVADALSRWLVEHADDDWRQAHVAIVGAVYGWQALKARATQQVPSEVPPAPPEPTTKRVNGSAPVATVAEPAEAEEEIREVVVAPPRKPAAARKDEPRRTAPADVRAPRPITGPTAKTLRKEKEAVALAAAQAVAPGALEWDRTKIIVVALAALAVVGLIAGIWLSY